MQDPDKLCSKILSMDRGIRFAGLANREGTILASMYRKGLRPLLTKEESELAVTQSIIRMGTRQTLESKLGRTVYAFALYEKVRRATIPVRDPGGHILMISFDVRSNHERIILKKVLPFLKRVRARTAP